MDGDFDQLHVIVPLILALLLVLVAIAGFAVCIKRSKKWTSSIDQLCKVIETLTFNGFFSHLKGQKVQIWWF